MRQQKYQPNGNNIEQIDPWAGSRISAEIFKNKLYNNILLVGGK